MLALRVQLMSELEGLSICFYSLYSYPLRSLLIRWAPVFLFSSHLVALNTVIIQLPSDSGHQVLIIGGQMWQNPPAFSSLESRLAGA